MKDQEHILQTRGVKAVYVDSDDNKVVEDTKQDYYENFGITLEVLKYIAYWQLDMYLYVDNSLAYHTLHVVP